MQVLLQLLNILLPLGYLSAVVVYVVLYTTRGPCPVGCRVPLSGHTALKRGRYGSITGRLRE